jgi:concanavalin A-like lectin/glucanase superfamily protein/IPT/TIG domain-containing protein
VSRPYSAAGLARLKPVFRIEGAPFITAITPSSWTAGNALTLTVDGINFTVDSRVRINGAEMVTTFVGVTQLTATIPGASIPTAATYDIDVLEPGLAFSNTVSLTIVADASYASVVLLLHGEGTDTSTTITDEKSHTMTANGNAQIDTAQKKFGSASILLDGTGDYASAADSADWFFSNNDFTLECWVRFNNTSGQQTFISQYDAGANQRSFSFGKTAGGLLEILISYTGSSNNIIKQETWSPSTGVWYHVAVSRNTNDLRLFLDGTQLGATVNISTNATHNSTEALRVGARGSTAADFLNGWLDDVRITKGVGRYTANFTPATQPFANA